MPKLQRPLFARNDYSYISKIDKKLAVSTPQSLSDDSFYEIEGNGENYQYKEGTKTPIEVDLS